MAFSPDGTKIVSGSDDQTIKVWDVANPRPYDPSEWKEVYGLFPGDDEDEDDKVNYWKNTVTGDVRREHSTAGVHASFEPT